MIQQVTLWEAQKKFFAAGPQPTLFFGGVGSGKTYVAILKMLALLDAYPGSRGAIVRQRFQQLKKTTAATLWKLLPREHILRKNDNDGTLTLQNGSQLMLIHLDKAESINNLKSFEINFAYVDQLEDISAEAWDVLNERVGRWSGATKRGGWPADWPYKDRLGNCVPPRYVFASAYSPGFDHWITQRFWEHGTERDRFKKQGYKVITGSTRDNLALSQEYLDSRLSMGSEYVKRYVDAVEWGAHEGRVFELSPKSILDPHPDLLDRIRRRMKLHRVYDHGEFSPAACLWYATDEKSNVFFYREYMQAEKLVSDHRRAIFELSKLDSLGADPPSYYSNLADPAIFAVSRGRTLSHGPSWSVADEWLDRKIMDSETAVYWRPADNNETMTVGRVREYLRCDPKHVHPVDGIPNSPRVYFIRKTADYPYGCHEVLADIRNAKREEIPGALTPDGRKMYTDDRDQKVRDHLLDCVRYALGMRPAWAREAPPPVSTNGVIDLQEYARLTGYDNFLDSVKRKQEPVRRYGYGGR